jgi:aspartate 1-decarboxylase
MMKKIALDQTLTDISHVLQESGYEVVDYSEENLKDIDAYVISGEDKNMMGMNGTATRQPVINAQGMSAKEIRFELQRRLF